jgi:hypothetical protein
MRRVAWCLDRTCNHVAPEGTAMTNTFDMSLVGDERQAVTQIVNMGIDARLEAFTRSTFRDTGYRLECQIHPAEMTILLRRLCDMDLDCDNEACTLAEDIAQICYLDDNED